MASAIEKARIWLERMPLDQEMRTEISESIKDEQRLLECFGQELSFGTGGLRGILGMGTKRMNRFTVARATQGLADDLAGGAVVIGYDTRNGSREFAEVTAGVLAKNGLTAYLFDRPLPTPLLSFAVRELGCASGVMITASHNPAEYNGYKVYGMDGCQITDDAAGEITGRIRRVRYEALGRMEEEEARRLHLLRDVPQRVYAAYIQRTLNCRLEPTGKSAPLKVVYTALHGTGVEPVCEVLSGLPGVILLRVEAQCVADGRFPTCTRPNPELPEALSLGLEAAKKATADLLLATDPDCDRVGVAVRKADGGYQILSGNEVGLLLLEYVLSMRAERGTLPESPVVIKTIATSDLAFPIAAAYGAEAWEVLTGFKYIGEKIGALAKGGQEDRFVFGFEESCGYLAGTHVRDKDGVMACLLISEMAQHHKACGLTLLQALARLYEAYGTMENALQTYDIAGALPMEVMDGMMKRLRRKPPVQLSGAPITSFRDYLPGLEGLPPSDVQLFSTDTGAKAIIRPSGTEPKIKVYLSARATTRQAAQDMLLKMLRETEAWLQPG